jgi:broad specificity phosphatase PhoE
VRIALVRHAPPQVSPDEPAWQWSLTADGRRLASELRTRLPANGIWIASDEVKATETLICARPDDAIEVRQDVRFGEVLRDEPFDDGFRDRRRAWVEGRLDEPHAGWESAREAAARFDAAINDYAEPGGPLVIGSHGMVITAWLVHIGAIRPGRPAGELWEAMKLPDIIEIEHQPPSG